MENTHIIQKQIFKIDIGNQHKYIEVCQIIESLFKFELGDHIQNILDQYNINDQDIIIDKLDIDLGNLDTGNLKNSIYTSFISSFQRALEEKIKRFPEQIRVVNRDTRNASIFHFFIKNGNTPWWVSIKSGDFKKDFTKYFYTRSDKNKSIWKKALKDPFQYKRLLYNLDLELLISRWVFTQCATFKVPNQLLVKAILEIVAMQGVIMGNDVIVTRIKSNIIKALFSSSNSATRLGGLTERIRNLFDNNFIDAYRIEKKIREIVKPTTTKENAHPKVKIVQDNIDKVFVANYDSELEEEFVHFLKYGYPLKRNVKGAFASFTSIFDYLVRTNINQLSLLLRFHARDIRIRQRFLNQVSQESISTFYNKIAPDKKDLFEWIDELYLPTEQILKPINQTNIRVQKVVNEVTLIIFIQKGLTNLNPEVFMRMHFKLMSLRYNIRYDELLKIILKIVKLKKNKKLYRSKFNTILERLYENAPGKKITPNQEVVDDEDSELLISQKKREIPENLLNQIPRDVIKELMHVKNSGILGKSSAAVQQLISAYIRQTDKVKQSTTYDPKNLIKNIAEFLEVDNEYLEFGLIFSGNLQRQSNLFLPQDELLYNYLSTSPIGANFLSRNELSIIIDHFLRYRNSYELPHLKKIFNKKMILGKVDKKIFNQFMNLIFGNQHKKIVNFISSIIISDNIESREKIQKQVYSTFLQLILSDTSTDFKITKLVSKFKNLLKGYVSDSVEVPKSVLSISSNYFVKIKKDNSSKTSRAPLYIKEKNLLILYHILELDLVLDNVGNNFFDNIIFSFDLLLTKHRSEFTEVLFRNRYNKELAYFLTYQDDAFLLKQIEKIFSVSKVERIHELLEMAVTVLEKLNWLMIPKSQVSKFATLSIYSTLFSKSNEQTSFHEFLYTILEIAKKENILSNDFYSFFELNNDKQIQRKIQEIFKKNSSSKELIIASIENISTFKISELKVLEQSDTDDFNDSYYFELILNVLFNLSFPEDHPFYGQSLNENRAYFNSIFKKYPVVLRKIQNKRLSQSQLELFVDLLDIDTIKLAIFNVYNSSSNNFKAVFDFLLKKVTRISNFDEIKFLRILLKRSSFSNQKNQNFQNKFITILLEEKIISPFDLFELLYEEDAIINGVDVNLQIETFLKNLPLNTNTWLDLYFKILSSAKYGNSKAYKVINSWILFMFSAPMHKTQKQAYIFIFTVYFNFSLWKIKDLLYLHEIFIDQSGVLKVKDFNSITLILKSLLDAGIPSQSILNATKNQGNIDYSFITTTLNNIVSENILKSDKNQSKSINRIFLTPSQFSKSLLFENSRNEKASSLFQVWIGEKNWSDTDLSRLFKIISLPVLLREIYSMSSVFDTKRIIEIWVDVLDKLNLFLDKNKRYYALISLILKFGIWKYKSEDLIHASLIKSLSIFNNKDRAYIFNVLTILTEAQIPLTNLPKLKGLGIGSQGEEINNLVEQYVLALSDPRMPENDKSLDEPYLSDQTEEDIIFFIQSGNYFVQNDKLVEREKLIMSRIKEMGVSKFLSYDNIHPETIEQMLSIFSKEDAKEYLLNCIQLFFAEEKYILFFNDVLNDFFDRADNESIIKIIKQFNKIEKSKTISDESRISLLIREISKVRYMELSIKKVFLLHQNKGLKKVEFLTNAISKSLDTQETLVTDGKIIFNYYLVYGLIMPGSFLRSLDELKSFLLNYIKKDPVALRYILHINSGNQNSRKRIVQLMRPAMSAEMLAIIHPNLEKELRLVEQLMKNNFNINIWEILNLYNDSTKSDHILLLWSRLNARIKDPIELIVLLLKSLLTNMDSVLLHEIQKYDTNRFIASEKTFWKELIVQIPELKPIPVVQKRKLKALNDLNETAESKERQEEIMDPEDGITVFNAGLVLLWPFLSRFFSLLGLSNANDFLGDTERARAIQLTQYLVTGTTEMEEWNLSLNKILCGADLKFPINPILDITIEEEGLAEKMLKGALQNWPKLKNTKPQTFQETFLRRQGRLYKRENRWELIVEKKAYDMLLTSLPWNISMIKLNWMSDRLVVEWN